MIRTTAPTGAPYNFDIPVSPNGSKFQCTWYCFYRALEEGYSAPCYNDRSKKSGSYTTAKLWPENFREPWEVKGPDYVPVHGDIAVFDGNYGHVVFIEDINGNKALISEYNRIAKETFSTDEWEYGKTLKGCGVLKGYLHYPYRSVDPVERDETVNQIQTTDSSLRIRNNPSLQADIIGHVQLGYYNVLSQTETDGYTWYEIEKGKYCANITTDYLPAKGTDIIEEIERYFRMMQDNVKQLTDERDKYRNIVSEVHKLTDVTD